MERLRCRRPFAKRTDADDLRRHQFISLDLSVLHSPAVIPVKLHELCHGSLIQANRGDGGRREVRGGTEEGQKKNQMAANQLSI
jgi:hypothetical protein